MNKIGTLLIICLMVSLGSRGQVASISLGDYTATPGGLVTVPVEFTDFDDVGAITLYIVYDQTVATLASNFGGIGNVVVNNVPYSGNQYVLGLSYAETTPVDGDGIIINLVFNYIGGTTPLEFLTPICEIANTLSQVLPAVYTNGSISSAVVPIPVDIVDQTGLTPVAPPNNYIDVPIWVDFSQAVGGAVGSFNFEIEYDNNLLGFQQILNPALSGITVNLLTNPSRIALIWNASTSGSGLIGNLLEMRFTYDGGNTELNFLTDACQIANFIAEVQEVSYSDGIIQQDPGTMPNVLIGTVEAEAGSPVTIPVTVENFGTIDWGALDYIIQFDPAVLSFTGLSGVSSKLSSGIIFNSTSNTVNVAWNGSLPDINFSDGELLFNLEFSYAGTNTIVSFDEQSCVMSDWDLNPIYAYYGPGGVNEIAGDNATVCMETVVGQQLNEVLMPVYVTGLNNVGVDDGVGAITLEIEFDQSLVNFMEVIIDPASPLATDGSSLINSVGGLLSYSWTIYGNPSTGIYIPDGEKLFDIKFYYLSGTADITFNNANCEIADVNILPMDVFYCDGQIRPGIEMELKVYLEGLYNTNTGEMRKTQDFISGSLTNKYPGTVADLIDVELHDKNDYSTIMHTITGVELNQDGTAFFEVPEQFTDSYWVTIKTRNHVETVSANIINFASGNVVYDFTTAATQAYGNNQKLLEPGVYGLYAGDVDQNGFVDVNDAGLINPAVLVALPGYVVYDLDGNGEVDVNDAGLANPNVLVGVEKVTP